MRWPRGDAIGARRASLGRRLVLAVGIGLSWGAARGADQPVLARVNGVAITSGAVEREIERAQGNRKLEGAAIDALRRQALAQLIDRELALEYLSQHGFAASDADIQLLVRRLTAELGLEKTTLADHLQRTGIAEAELRRKFAWQISWKRYLDQTLVEAHVEAHFRKRRAHFDGTQLRVAHILFKLPATSKPEEVEGACRRARDLRKDIVAGKQTFAAAARKHSDSPTADRGGDIGWIGRHEPMAEPFSAAAFELAKGDISEPVVTTIGVHLVTCVDRKEGTRTFSNVREAVVDDARAYLFNWIAERERATAKIEYFKTPL